MPSTTHPPAERLLVFARVPEAGAVKTRLAASIGNERALSVYSAMLRDVIASVGESTVNREIEYLWAPTAIANAVTLHAAFGNRSMAMQTGEGLGDRLSMAFSERFFFHRTMKIVALGVDDPLIPAALIDHAFHLLDSCEWAVGPATDGGYYLIGCRAAAFSVGVFSGIEWGTGSVLAATLEKIGSRGSSVALLPPRSDIDLAEDLDRFAADSTGGALHDLLKVR